MVTPTPWTWVWANSERCWRTGCATVHGVTESQIWLRDWISSIIALQGCVHFCCTTGSISYMYAYIPWLLILSAIPNPYPTLLGHYRALSSTPGAQLFTLHSRFPLVIYFIHNSMSNPDLLIRPTAFSLLGPYVHSLHLPLYSYLGNRFTHTIF